MRFSVVWTTVPDGRTARRLARLLVERKLAACVSCRDGFQSVYHWKGVIEKAYETLVVIKTSTGKLACLEKVLREHHPYDIPEFLVFPVSKGSKEYLTWMKDSLK